MWSTRLILMSSCCRQFQLSAAICTILNCPNPPFCTRPRTRRTLGQCRRRLFLILQIIELKQNFKKVAKTVPVNSSTIYLYFGSFNFVHFILHEKCVILITHSFQVQFYRTVQSVYLINHQWRRLGYVHTLHARRCQC